MNITVNGNNNTIIDLSGIRTYGELKEALPTTGTRRVPGIKQLMNTAKVILHRETGTGTIEIYDNGFFTFKELDAPTVWGVDRCDWSDLYSEGKHTKGQKKEDFNSYPWDMILESAGVSRLSHNADSREVYRSEISLDAPESENNIKYSIQPEYEIRDEEEESVIWYSNRRQNMKKALDKLTDKQREIMMMDRVEKLTQEQISDRMGISRRTVREHLEAIEKKMRKVF